MSQVAELVCGIGARARGEPGATWPAEQPSTSLLAKPHFLHWTWCISINILLKVINFCLSTPFQKMGCKLSGSCTNGRSNSCGHLETLGLSNWVIVWLSPALQSSPLCFPHILRHIQVRHLCSWRVWENATFCKSKDFEILCQTFSSYGLSYALLRNIPIWDRLCCQEILDCSKRRNLVASVALL